MKKLILTLMILMACNGCTIKNGTNIDLTKPIMLDTRPPEGPDIYQKGWADGCESGISSANQLIQFAFKTHQYSLDEQLVYDPMYWRVWNDAYNYCAFSVMSEIKYAQ